MAYEVTHHTEYHYPSTVSSSFGEIVMLPRELAGQACLRSELTIEPAPHDLRERLDFFGNRTAYFAVLAPHTRLSVTAASLVRVHDRQIGPAPQSKAAWEQARVRATTNSDTSTGTSAYANAEVLEASQFVLDSPLVTLSEQLAEY